MNKNNSIIKNITCFILPYIFLYSFYIQINGEVSPGGGFQAGVIFASSMIGLDLTSNKFILNNYFSINLLVFIAVFGVMIYGIVGLVPFLFDKNYLNYYVFVNKALQAQHFGIFVIEWAIGLTVTAIMCLIYSVIVMKTDEDL